MIDQLYSPQNKQNTSNTRANSNTIKNKHDNVAGYV